MKNIVVIGGGFAGLWSALGAARRLDEEGETDIHVTLVNRDEWHAIRVRLYEPDISGARVPLAEVLEPAGIELVVGEVTGFDFDARTIALGDKTLPYDRLVIAAGSRLNRPDIPGLDEHAFSIDTWNDANALNNHLKALPDNQTVLIIGGGLTGVELACEMPARLRDLGLSDGRVILADRHDTIGSNMGPHAVPVIEDAPSELGVEIRLGIGIASIDVGGVTLDDGSRIDATTVVWSAGMSAGPIAAMVPVAHDNFGRIPVDRNMGVVGLDNVYGAGDIAAAPLNADHDTVMSRQHARPMGRFAGHNVVGDLLGLHMLEMDINYYVTCLDLGPWGALYTEGWDRQVSAGGPSAKQTKMTINRERIYPPRNGDRRDILDAASPHVQMAPSRQ
ncbi:MAG: FAD-dependent oxidoreductase [Pseudomonadota bacterium]|nr:FAD-dependent oxidoreductase [Pseudomonadota bacterium]